MQRAHAEYYIDRFLLDRWRKCGRFWLSSAAAQTERVREREREREGEREREIERERHRNRRDRERGRERESSASTGDRSLARVNLQRPMLATQLTTIARELH